MTLEEALKLEAGHELDRLIAERVMGWKDTGRHSVERLPIYNAGRLQDVWLRDWKPSTDVAAAWEVVEKLNRLQFTIGRENCDGVRFDAEFYDALDKSDRSYAHAETAPLAICRAALKATWWPKQAGDTG